MADKSYKKRIGWFESMPGYPIECTFQAVAEYLGSFPKEIPAIHGDAVKTNQEYIRSPPNTKKALVEDLATKKTVRQIYEERLGTDQAPRDSKQIHNLKAKLTKESNPRNHKNNTDDI